VAGCRQNDGMHRALWGVWPAALILTVAPALALPPDPQRAMEAGTCEAAKARYREAQSGSPLISPAENAAVLARAAEQMRQLCGTDAPAWKKTQDCPKRLPEED